MRTTRYCNPVSIYWNLCMYAQRITNPSYHNGARSKLISMLNQVYQIACATLLSSEGGPNSMQLVAGSIARPPITPVDGPPASPFHLSLHEWKEIFCASMAQMWQMSMPLITSHKRVMNWPCHFLLLIYTVMQPIASCLCEHHAFYTLFEVHCEVEAHCRHLRSSAQSMQLEAMQPHGLTAINTWECPCKNFRIDITHSSLTEPFLLCICRNRCMYTQLCKSEGGTTWILTCLNVLLWRWYCLRMNRSSSFVSWCSMCVLLMHLATLWNVQVTWDMMPLAMSATTSNWWAFKAMKCLKMIQPMKRYSCTILHDISWSFICYERRKL